MPPQFRLPDQCSCGRLQEFRLRRPYRRRFLQSVECVPSDDTSLRGVRSSVPWYLLLLAHAGHASQYQLSSADPTVTSTGDARFSKHTKRKRDHLATAIWKNRTTYVKRSTITVLQCPRSRCVFLNEEIAERIAWDSRRFYPLLPHFST